MAKIHISVEAVRDRAGQYKDEAQKLHDIAAVMDGYIEKLPEEWEGLSSQSFIETYRTLRPAFTQAEELIREIAKALDDSATRFEVADQDMANQFQG